jgi:hypothetical protein
LAARLSHPARPLKHAHYIGPLNRFAWEKPESAQGFSEATREASPRPTSPTIDWLAIISGPEPQRQAFENELRRQLSQAGGTRILILGKPGAQPRPAEGEIHSSSPENATLHPGELHVFNHVDGKTLNGWLQGAKAIVTRSGYTTVMEMACLGIRPLLMVPTPGQPEQEYLAKELARGNWIVTQNQEALDLSAALPALQNALGLNRLLDQNQSPGATREGLMDFLRHQIPLFQ